MMRNVFLAAFFISSLGACTLYKSSGREALEKNEGGIIGVFAKGFDAENDYYYSCSSSKIVPEFLKQALVVIETPFESQNFSTLLSEQRSIMRVSQSLIVYRLDEETETYNYCRISYLRQIPMTSSQLLTAAKMGVDLILTKD